MNKDLTGFKYQHTCENVQIQKQFIFPFQSSDKEYPTITNSFCNILNTPLNI